MDGPDHVLVPTLGLPRDDEALDYALETFPDAVVTLLAVVAPLDTPLSEGRILERDDERVERARQRAESLVESSVDPSRVAVETCVGRPAEAVPAYVEDEGVDHVVVAGHDAGLVRRLLGDGVPRTIEKRASVPVTVLE